MKKGFTLIELLAVIVVLAILALVVTPIVLNIVENAQTGSDERSLEQYAKVMQTTFYELKMKDTSLTLQDYLDKVDTNDTKAVSLTYNGSRVICETKKVSETAGTQTIELYNCTVDGRGLYQFVDGKAEKVGEYKKYENGEIVYFDVAKGTVCTKNEYDSSWDGTDYSNSYTNYNGITKTNDKHNRCLKFYAFNDAKESKILNLLLDHNINEYSIWNSTGNGPQDVIKKLKESTADWKGTIEPSDYMYKHSERPYTVDYSGYKARLITANEIAKITGNIGWDETSSSNSWYYFQDLSQNYDTGSGDVCASTGCKYGWLYDRTSPNCRTYGCLNNSDGSLSSRHIYGYWTVTADASNGWTAHIVDFHGELSVRNRTYNELGDPSNSGVRPVITIPKS